VHVQVVLQTLFSQLTSICPGGHGIKQVPSVGWIT
jgi:hypothetical protein